MTVPASALATVDNRPYDIFEKLTINVAGEQQYVPGEILVKFKPGVSEEKIRSINAAHGTQVTYTSPYAGFKKLKLPRGKSVEEMVEIYGRNPNIEYVTPNVIMHAYMVPNDPLYGYQWNFKNGAGGINLEPAWEISTGKGVIVAVLDTGVAYETWGLYIVAPDLAQTNFIQGYDFVNDDSHPNDDEGHGTHVAGTIAQNTNNGIGVAGVAFNCSIMPVKVLGANGAGTLDQIADGIYFATDQKADVISMSLGYQNSSVNPLLKEALDYADDHSVTIVAAAGNDGKDTVSYPAAYEKCIAVGATNYVGARASYSNYGNDLDVVAPGGDGQDLNGDGYMDGILQNTFGRKPTRMGYYFYTGTSMATPHVSGVAALLISAKPGATPDEVRVAIQNTAKDLGTIDGWEPEYGWGLVDAKAALDHITQGSEQNIPPVADAGGPYSGEVGQAVTFYGSGYDQDGSIVSYDWDFGDGSTATGTTTPTHTYTAADTYDVVLTVTDDEGATDSDTATVEITAANNGASLHIDSVEVTLNPPKKAGKNYFFSATAVVKILDNNYSPVGNAIISGLWSGATIETDTALTNTSGFATVSSAEVKYTYEPLTFNFTVNNVTYSSYTWDEIALGDEITYDPQNPN